MGEEGIVFFLGVGRFLYHLTMELIFNANDFLLLRLNAKMNTFNFNKKIRSLDVRHMSPLDAHYSAIILTFIY